MIATFLYLSNAIFGLLALAGDWYSIKRDYLDINNCYTFPAGTFNLWDYHCGLTANEFIDKYPFYVQENSFLRTMSRMRFFTVISYGFSTISFLIQLFIPTMYKLHITILTITGASSCTGVYYYWNGYNLIEDTNFKDLIFPYNLGFICLCFTIPITIIAIFYKIELYLRYNKYISRSDIKQT